MTQCWTNEQQSNHPYSDHLKISKSAYTPHIFAICFRDSTVKPAHEVISIKQSPVLKGQMFLVLSWKISYELNLLRGHLSYGATYSVSQR